MKPKNTLILAVIAILVGALVLLQKSRQQTIAVTAQAPTREVLPAITSSTLTRIEIRVPTGTTTTLERDGDQWFADKAKGHKADKNFIANLFKALGQPISGEVVSTSKESHTDYEVTETSGTKVKLVGNDGKANELIIGKSGLSFFTTHVRKPDSDEVINAKGSLGMEFNKPEGWRDKSIFEIPPDTLVSLSGEGTSGTWTARRSQGQWYIMDGETSTVAAQEKLTPLAGIIGGLRTSDFPEIEGTTTTLGDIGLDPPRQKLTIVHEDRSTSPAKEVTSTLVIGDKDTTTGFWFAKKPDSPILYAITDFQAQTMAPELKDLVPPVGDVAPEPAPTGPDEPTTPSEPAMTEMTGTAETTASDDASTVTSQFGVVPEPETTSTAPVPVETPIAVSTPRRGPESKAPGATIPAPAAPKPPVTENLDQPKNLVVESSSGGPVQPASTGEAAVTLRAQGLGSSTTGTVSVAPAEGRFVQAAEPARAETLSVDQKKDPETPAVTVQGRPNTDQPDATPTTVTITAPSR